MYDIKSGDIISKKERDSYITDRLMEYQEEEDQKNTDEYSQKQMNFKRNSMVQQYLNWRIQYCINR